MARKPSLERRAAFMEAALRLFVKNGVQNTSTAAIAKEAGSASGTLFLYFSTKQALIDELVLQISRQQSEHMGEQLKPTLSVKDTFFAIWDGSIRWFMKNMDAFLYVQQIRDAGIISEDIVAETEKHLAYYFMAINKGYESEQIKPYSAELIGTILYQDIVAVMNLIRNQPDPGKQETYIKAGFDIFWHGIKA